MGRFYKASRANHIDYAFKLPAAYIANAIANEDKQIDTTIKSTAIVKQSIDNEKKQALSLSYSPQDEELFNQTIAKHETAIDDVTNAIMENPLDSYKQRVNIMNIQSNLRNDIMSGTLGKINQNATQMQQIIKDNKTADPISFNTMISYGLSKWGSSFDSDGNFKDIRKYLPTKISNVNVATEATKLAGKFKANGMFDNKTISMKTALSNTTVQFENSLLNNEQLLQSELQKVKYGYYGDNEANKSPEEQLNFIHNIIKKAATNAAQLTLHYKPTKNSTTGKIAKRDMPAYPTTYPSTAPTKNLVYDDLAKFQSNNNNEPLTEQQLNILSTVYQNKVNETNDVLSSPDSEQDKRVALQQNIESKIKEVQLDSYIKKAKQTPAGELGQVTINANNVPKVTNSSLQEQTSWPDSINNAPVTNDMLSNWKKDILTGLNTNYMSLPIISNNPKINGKSINQLIHEGKIKQKIKNQKQINTEISRIKTQVVADGFQINNNNYKEIPIANGVYIVYNTIEDNKIVSHSKDIPYEYVIGKYEGFNIDIKNFTPPTTTLYEDSPLIGLNATIDNTHQKVFFKLADVAPTTYRLILNDKTLNNDYYTNTLFYNITNSIPTNKSINLTDSGNVKIGKNNKGTLYMQINDKMITDISNIYKLINQYIKIQTNAK